MKEAGCRLLWRILSGRTRRDVRKQASPKKTADGISAVFELITDINTHLGDGATKAFAAACLDLLTELTNVLGLLMQEDEGEEIDAELQALIDERQQARKNKDYARADEIRDTLKERGITLKDTPQGVQIIRE